MNNIKVGWQLVMNKTMEGFFRVQIFQCACSFNDDV